ncbi:class I SAM-dependent methyltransferase [Mariniblastus fucicola]|uniref:Demethylrebeccamycin-D-glucose O-methyltransferase n=1 Tax=Mariniblastus fucicola TaxID=980251 RepID=A0A5B9PDU5_9BACT|nr:class I SAM-dependent methyltransferase [Mariniblastus fucicola]QEG24578.1 Demethylrebeccamycin-D-glucose O-methyltransferase [Mariniblastus fucicola]
MLKRTLEPEVMDSAQDALEYNRMDHGAVNVNFVDDFLQFLSAHGKRLRLADDPSFDDLEDDYPDVIASFLDVGTGTALIPIELCKRNPEIRIMAIDLATSMLDLAIQNVDIASFRNQIQLAQVDAKDSGYEDGMFDATISNSIIHHIPEPSMTASEMIRTTRSGGVIFVRDLMRPDSAQSVDSLVETWAGEESDYSRRLFGESLHASLSLNEMKELVAEFGASPDTVTATSDRHWTWAMVR